MTIAGSRPEADMTGQDDHNQNSIQSTDRFSRRHIGPDSQEISEMLKSLGYQDLDGLIDDAIPASIRSRRPLELCAPAGEEGLSERDALHEIGRLAEQNKTWRNFIGMGYHGTVTPTVILRTVVENPCWYTQYTPYQAELSQGRLEALLNFQTMICDLTALPIAGASLLDEGTAAAEAMAMCVAQHRRSRMDFFVAADCHPQTIAVLKTRASGLGVKLVIGEIDDFDAKSGQWAGVLVQYPGTGWHDSKLQDACGVGGCRRHAGRRRSRSDVPVSAGSSRRMGCRHRKSDPPSASECPWVMAGLTPHISHAVKHSFERCRGRLIGVSKDAQGDLAVAHGDPDS